jgi:HEAT repeat protein
MIEQAKGPGARALAVSQMMGLGFRDMTEQAADLLADPALDALGRIALIEVLPCSSRDEAVKLVETQCNAAEGGAVRAAAVRALSRMESPRLSDVAEAMLKDDPSSQARTAAAEALADCLRYFDADGERRVARLLDRRTAEESSLCRAQLMRAAVHGGLTDPTLLGKVLAAKSVPPNEKRAAARALAEINSPEAVSVIETHLTTGLDQPTRRLVFTALRRMSCPASREALARWTAAPATRPGEHE